MQRTEIPNQPDNARPRFCRTRLAMLRALLRSLNGDAAYERYLAHWGTHPHAPDERPLNRKAFFAAETLRKWNGVKRCC